MIISNLYGLIFNIKHILFCVLNNLKFYYLTEGIFGKYVIFITVVVYTYTENLCVSAVQRDYAICR
jgi:hypothetical protein